MKHRLTRPVLFVVTLILTLAANLVTTAPAKAHIGGKSAVKINGFNVSSNAFAAYYAPIPSDIGVQTLVPGQEATFEVDTTITQGGKGDYRWYWEAEDATKFSDGTTVKHAFDKVGMHLVYLKYRGTQSSTYDVIDTVGVAVAPIANYKMPKLALKVTPIEIKGQNYSFTFAADAKSDPSATITGYKWQFGVDEANKIPGQSIVRSFNTIREVNNAIIGVTATDSNGLHTNAALHVTLNSSGAMDTAVVQDDYQDAIKNPNANNNPSALLYVALVLLGIIIVAGIRSLHHKPKRHKKAKS